MASAAARPAAIWSWPGWPNTTPVIAVRLPSIQRMARKAMGGVADRVGYSRWRRDEAAGGDDDRLCLVSDLEGQLAL
jgi:hypothetical protein